MTHEGQPEEGFIRMYAHDFALMAARAESGQDVEEALTRRMREARAHAAIMDARKASGHLEAVVARLRAESLRTEVRHGRVGPEAPEQLNRRRLFLSRVAEMLETPIAVAA
jgi:hypothetical protein